MTNLRATLAQDIDCVLAWVYGEVHSDAAVLVEELATIFCDKSEVLTVRVNAASAFLAFAPDLDLSDGLLGRTEVVHRDKTEPLAIRSAATSMCASLRAPRRK